MWEPLDWGLLFGSVDFGKGPFDSFSEFIREEAAERDDEVDDFWVHMGEV